MIGALKGLFTSKTFWLTIIGTVVITLLAAVLPLIGISPEMISQIQMYVAGFFGIKGIQQASADFNKNAK